MFFKLGGNWYFTDATLVTASAISASEKLQERLEKEAQGAKHKSVTKIDLSENEASAIAALLASASTVGLTNR